MGEAASGVRWGGGIRVGWWGFRSAGWVWGGVGCECGVVRRGEGREGKNFNFFFF